MKKIKVLRGPLAPYAEGKCSINNTIVDVFERIPANTSKILIQLTSAPTGTVFNVSDANTQRLKDLLSEDIDHLEPEIDYYFRFGYDLNDL